MILWEGYYEPLLTYKHENPDEPIIIMLEFAKGQSLSIVGVYLPEPVFTHGQLYVAVSRVKSKRGLKIICLDFDGKPWKYTTNVIYKEVF
ncbi:hypothetical protein ACS0TY_008155 [Phlomoides rotata]